MNFFLKIMIKKLSKVKSMKKINKNSYKNKKIIKMNKMMHHNTIHISMII